MKILLVNDDGIQAKGIRALVDAFKEEHEVYVSAPAAQKSGFSHCVTFFHDKIKVTEEYIEGAVKAWAVDGTPADCTYLGIFALMKEKPDVVISGINHGPNLSSDCTYSGTVGAALEGMMANIPSMAVSLCSFTEDYFQQAASVAKAILPVFMSSEERCNYVLNVNVPAIPLEEIKGIKVTRLDVPRKCTQDFHQEENEDGSITISCVSFPDDSAFKEGIEDGDITATRNGYVSVTPLYEDMCHHDVRKSIFSFENIKISYCI